MENVNNLRTNHFGVYTSPQSTPSRRFKFGKIVIHLPSVYRNYEKDREIVKISPEKSQEVANSVTKLITELNNLFGEGTISASGSLVRGNNQNTWYGDTSIIHTGLKNLIPKLRDIIEDQGSMTDDYSYRLQRRENPYTMFELDVAQEYVNGFESKSSPFRIGLKKYEPELLEAFDNSIKEDKNTNTFSRRKKDHLSIEEITRAVVATRKYIVDKLESVDVEATPLNIARMAEYLYIKNFRVVKESLIGMPFLKVDRELEKNLARMVGRGLTYERLLIFNITENYAEDNDMLTMILSTPHNWMVKIVA